MPLRYESLVDLLTRACERHAGSRLFGVQSDGAFAWTTYEAFTHEVAGFRGALRALGVEPGDRVAAVSHNCVPWAVAAFATLGLGAIYVPVFPGQSEETLVHVLRHSGARVVLAGTEEIRDRVVEAQAACPRLEHVLGFETSGRPHAFAAHLLKGHDVDAPAVRPGKEDPAAILYTSGTTGTPKGVVLSHGNIISNVNAVHQVHDIGPEDVSCSFLPWAHAFGLTCELFGMMAGGGSVALSRDMTTLSEDLLRVRPTVLFAVPQVWNTIHAQLQDMLADAPSAKRAMFERGFAVARRRRESVASGERSFRLEAEYALFNNLLFSQIRERFGGRLRYAISGGASLSEPVAQLIEDIGIELFEGYGLTETSPIVTCNTPDAHRLGTVGRSIPGVDIFVCDEEGRVLGPQQEGELVVAGPNVMLRYHEDTEATDAVIFDLDGLRAFRTGDLGTLSPAGFLTITGRRKEQYKLADGTFALPMPLELRLEMSPLISRAFVYGEGRAHNVALIVPDFGALESWARAESLGEMDADALSQHPAVHARVGEAIAACFEDAPADAPKAWAVLGTPFSVEDETLTPKLSLRRAVIAKRYRAILDSLYTA